MPILTEITSRQCRAYLGEQGDLAIIPVGSPERLGPHLPLSARTLVSQSIADLLAEQNNGMLLPLIPYSTVYDTFEEQGSIDIHPDVMSRYFIDLCDELMANGFRRILFVGFFDEFYYVCNEYFQKHNMAIGWLDPDYFFDGRYTASHSLDVHGRELWRLLGCLLATGQRQMVQRILEKLKEQWGRHPVVVDPCKQHLDQFGRTGHTMAPGEWRFYPVLPGKGLESVQEAYTDPPADLLARAQAELLGWVNTLGESLANLSVYQDFLDHTPVIRQQ